jgi:hypothetical protein
MTPTYEHPKDIWELREYLCSFGFNKDKVDSGEVAEKREEIYENIRDVMFKRLKKTPPSTSDVRHKDRALRNMYGDSIDNIMTAHDTKNWTRFMQSVQNFFTKLDIDCGWHKT